MEANETHSNGNGRQQQSGLVVRDTFAGAEKMQLAELSSQAVAMQARAQVEARYIMAIQRPRDMDRVRVTMLKESARPSFAAVARYSKPIGGSSVEGFSIRFAEAVLRSIGNVHVESVTLYDDAEKRIVRVSATDLEVNLTLNKDITINKTVERRKVREGQTVITSRLNTGGQRVYIVEATEDDLAVKEAALTSKALRQLALRLIPGDILDECLTKVEETLRNRDAKDPDTEKKKLADAFAALGVTPDQLAELLGHKLEQIVPAELKTLREIYTAIKDGDATWFEYIDAKRGERAAAATPATSPAAGPAPKNAAELLAQQLQQRKAPPPADPGGSFQPTEEPIAPNPTAPASQHADASRSSPPEQKETATPVPAETIPFAEKKAKLNLMATEFLRLIGGDKDRARALWTGSTPGVEGVKSLRGCTTEKAWDERLEQGRKMLHRAELDQELTKARKEIIEKLGTVPGLVVIRKIGTTEGAFSMDVGKAHEHLSAMLAELARIKSNETATPEVVVPGAEELEWDDTGGAPDEAPEPGSDG